MCHPNPGRKTNLARDTPWVQGKGNPGNAMFSLGTATLGRGEQRQHLCHPPRDMVVLPALSSPAIPTYSSSSRWWQYPRPDARWTRLSVLTQLEVSLLGTKEWQVRQSPGLRRSETDDRSWEWWLGTVGRGHLSSINLAALD